jgi:ERAP1-like C-terminal domain
MADNRSVWSQILSSLAKCRAVFASNQKVFDGLRKFTLKLVSPAAEKIGWEFKDNEDYLTMQLRKLLLGMASGSGHEG